MSAGRLSGRAAVVTGGASGIGEATVRRFVAEGARCVLADIQRERGTALAEELGDAVVFTRCDVTREEDVAAAVDLAVTRFGALDVMVNNAGVVGVTGPIASTPAEGWRSTIAVDLDSVFFGMKHAARVMTGQGSGVILSTSSIAGVTGGLGPHVYTAAKHAVVGLTKSVAAELAGAGIRVNCIAPAGVVTPLIARAFGEGPDDEEGATRHIAENSPLRRAGTAHDVAAAAAYLASDDASYVTGHCLVVDAGRTTGAGLTPPWFTSGDAAR